MVCACVLACAYIRSLPVVLLGACIYINYHVSAGVGPMSIQVGNDTHMDRDMLNIIQIEAREERFDREGKKPVKIRGSQQELYQAR